MRSSRVSAALTGAAADEGAAGIGLLPEAADADTTGLLVVFLLTIFKLGIFSELDAYSREMNIQTRAT